MSELHQGQAVQARPNRSGRRPGLAWPRLTGVLVAVVAALLAAGQGRAGEISEDAANFVFYGEGFDKSTHYNVTRSFGSVTFGVWTGETRMAVIENYLILGDWTFDLSAPGIVHMIKQQFESIGMELTPTDFQGTKVYTNLVGSATYRRFTAQGESGGIGCFGFNQNYRGGASWLAFYATPSP